MRQLEDEVFLYCEDHEGMEMAGLTAHFGTPEEVANNFLTELAPAVRWKYERNKRRVLYAAVGIFLIAIFLIFAMKLHTYVKQQDIVNGYYVETITYTGEQSDQASVYEMVTSDGRRWEYDARENAWKNVSDPVQ